MQAKPAKKVVAPVSTKSAVNGTNGTHLPTTGSARLNGVLNKPIAQNGSAAGPTSKPVVVPGKSKRNLAGLGVKELAHFRALLLEKRHDILGDMNSMEKEALRMDGSNLTTVPVHVTDMGTDNYEQEFTLGLVEKERTLLREIYAALAKMQAGTYGICEGTGAAISKARLEVQPWARYSIEFARLREKSTMGIR